MFDAVKFGVGVVTDEEFDSLDQDKLQYNYAWTYNEKPQTELEEKNVSEDLMKAMGKVVTLEILYRNIRIRRLYLLEMIWEVTRQ